jgi:hypothetical protein
MYISEAIDTIRNSIVEHRIASGADLWSTILKQIEKRGSFDGDYVDNIICFIRSFLSQLDDGTVISLWRTTETGMADSDEDESLFPETVRMTLEMELLEAITNVAREESGRST